MFGDRIYEEDLFGLAESLTVWVYVEDTYESFLHPDLAKKIGLQHNDLIDITSNHAPGQIVTTIIRTDYENYYQELKKLRFAIISRHEHLENPPYYKDRIEHKVTDENRTRVVYEQGYSMILQRRLAELLKIINYEPVTIQLSKLCVIEKIVIEPIESKKEIEFLNVDMIESRFVKGIVSCIQYRRYKVGDVFTFDHETYHTNSRKYPENWIKFKIIKIIPSNAYYISSACGIYIKSKDNIYTIL